MKRVSLIALLAAAALALASGAALAQTGSLISVGLEMHGNDSHVYFYGEVGLTPTLLGTFEYADKEPLTIGLWHGIGQGFYGSFALATEGSSQAIEAGVWRAFPLSDTIEVTGWIGAATTLSGDRDTWAEIGAEVEIPLAQTFAAFAGAETTLLKNKNQTTTWVGVGLRF